MDPLMAALSAVPGIANKALENPEGTSKLVVAAGDAFGRYINTGADAYIRLAKNVNPLALAIGAFHQGQGEPKGPNYVGWAIGGTLGLAALAAAGFAVYKLSGPAADAAAAANTTARTIQHTLDVFSAPVQATERAAQSAADYLGRTVTNASKAATKAVGDVERSAEQAARDALRAIGIRL